MVLKTLQRKLKLTWFHGANGNNSSLALHAFAITLKKKVEMVSIKVTVRNPYDEVRHAHLHIHTNNDAMRDLFLISSLRVASVDNYLIYRVTNSQ